MHHDPETPPASPPPPDPEQDTTLQPAHQRHRVHCAAQPDPAPRPSRHAELHQRATRAWAPPSVLVDASWRILHLSEGLSRWLQVQSGALSPHLLDYVHPELRLDLRTALFRAQPAAPGAEAPAVTMESDCADGRVRITVQPLRDPHEGLDLLLVVFEAVPRQPPAGGDTEPVEEGLARRLDEEVRRLQQHLQQVVEHAEASTEELKSSNEELQAVNEELQSANEALTTVNSQLALKVEEAGRVNDDLHDFINANDIATVFVDRSMRIKRYTPRATTLFNLIPGDVGRSLLDITHRLDYPTLVQDAHAAFQDLRPVEREVHGGQGQVFLARMLPYRTAEDRIEGAILNFVDITALRRSQEAARSGAERLQLAAETTRDFAILTMDEAGLVSSWNQGASRLFGYAEGEIVGQDFAQLFTEEDRAAGVPTQELAHARESGRADDERWHRRKDGSVLFCSGVTTRLEGGRGFAKIARDLTGSQQASAARERLLTREQAGRRHAEATMETKELFLAVMSHELKHPLNLIHVNAELLARMPEIRHIPAATRAAAIIQQTVAGQARIVDDLLDLSRARTGKLRLDRSVIDWAQTVRRIVDAMRPEAQAKGVHLHHELGTQPLLSVFDPVRAEQVVWNLLSNALKFTPEGGSVRVALAAEGDDARLTVTDSGRGIEPAFVDRVFEMFSQEGGPARREHDGLGIGLALVRELVQAHGGRVQARSEGLGRGAEFSVRVPQHHGEAPAAPPADTPSALKGLRLLVVDDSADSVESFAMLLELSGAQVATAGSGEEALRHMDAQAFDVLVSDVSMPGMSGHQLIQAVRQRPDGRRLIALACSGYSRAQDERRALEAGFDALVPKPAGLEQVERAVAALQARRTGR